MAATWKLYISCWFLGAAVQSAVFFSFNAVDYFNFFFPDNYKPEVYIGVTVGVGASIGAVLTVLFPPKKKSLHVLLATLITSAVVLIVQVIITPLPASTMKDEVRFGFLLGLVFFATVFQSVGGGALYNFIGKHFPKLGVHAAQSGGVCSFAATFVVRCISKGSFGHEKDVRRGFRLSGYLFVALVDLIVLVAMCLIFVLHQYEHEQDADKELENGEVQPLLPQSEELTNISRKMIIKKNGGALSTICLTLVISNALFPGITSQFHGNSSNCSNSTHHSSNSSLSENIEALSSSSITGDKTGWFVVILFGCLSVADAIGKNLPILGIVYNKNTIVFNLLVQLVIAVPILLIYFEPCVTQLQADWVADLTVGLLGLVNGYGLCAAMMLLAPGKHGKKLEEGMASSIGFMFLQVGILTRHGIWSVSRGVRV